jgi:hypothetical protein
MEAGHLCDRVGAAKRLCTLPIDWQIFILHDLQEDVYLDDRLAEGMAAFLGSPESDMIERRYFFGPSDAETGCIVLQEERSLISRVGFSI